MFEDHVYTLLAAAQHQRRLHQTSLVSSPNERWRCLPRPPEEIQSHLILSRQHVLASQCCKQSTFPRQAAGDRSSRSIL
ncbi:hypothetical protein C0Q70_19152 [Pomacea canaliculata]|uniref:Uncharacterized protein n=1 Tax=Pomacea canaliculata TaxID=400727 RepID=A0A2T7NIL1_POMCA|nr:hypothetical protein C0Q70_19152 [Pomacea canaliculata]